jgi:hypothetical protein
MNAAHIEIIVKSNYKASGEKMKNAVDCTTGRRVLKPVKDDIFFVPMDVGVFGAAGIAALADGVAELVFESLGGHGGVLVEYLGS